MTSAAHDREVEPGHLVVTDDEDVRHVYAVSRAEYNVYRIGDLYWLTLVLDAEEKVEPHDSENPEPNLELNLFFSESPVSRLEPGSRFEVHSYDESLYNLTAMYYWTHRPVDGELTILSVTAGQLTARLLGESDDDPVAICATFTKNPELKRSFD